MSKTKRLRRLATLAIALTGAIALVPGRAAATVYEVGDDGIARIYGTQVPAEGGVSGNAAAPEAAPEVPAIAITTIAEPNVPPDYRASLLNASSQYQVSPRLLAALTRQESAWRGSAVSPKGAIGLTQLMPATARELQVDPRDPAANLAGGARYLRQLLDRFDGDIERALAAYNAGPGRVARSKGIPAIPETRAYVASIVDRLGILAATEGSK